jgi:hypothetical protein
VSRLQSAAKNVPRTPTAASRAAGVSPPWYGNGSHLQGTANNVRRTPTAQSRAATVSPPWFGNGPRLQGTANNVRRTPTAQSRAVVVSPPWVGNRACNGDRFLWSDYVHHARSDGTPRLAHVSRSWCATRVSGKITTFAMRKRTFYKSGGCQPAVVRESRRQHRTFLVERGCSHATWGLRPPVLVVLRCGRLPAKLRLVRYTNARLQERRPSARRG